MTMLYVDLNPVENVYRGRMDVKFQFGKRLKSVPIDAQ
jgi:hypothetical protein